MPYSSVATTHATTAQPVPPGLKAAALPAWLHASSAMLPMPIAMPSQRVGARRSPSQTQATSAPNSGAVALRIADRPALIDRAA